MDDEPFQNETTLIGKDLLHGEINFSSINLKTTNSGKSYLSWNCNSSS